MQGFATVGRVGVLGAALLLAACGGGGGGGSGGGVLPPPPPPPPPPTDTAYLVSGPSPLAPNCEGVATGGTVYVGAEVEPHVAANPLDRNTLLGAWQQDRWSNGSARALYAATSTDGGRTWTRTPLPFSRCGGGTAANGGDYERVSDPWVTYTPTGVAYAMGLATTGGAFQPGSANAMLVSRSTDNGLSWSAPVTLIRDGAAFFNDKNTITADPTSPNHVYAVWDRLAAGGGGPTYFARTTDNGATWEPARAIYDPGPASQTIGNVIAVLPNTTLVNLFTEIDGANNARITVIRSTDRGVTWSAPVYIADLLAVGASDPQTGTPVRDGSILAQIAVSPAGELYVVWQDARFNNGAYDAIAMSRSGDGGLTWSTPVRVNTAANVDAFTPSVHVRGDGVVGVTYFDFRSDTPAAPLLTDYWLARSANGGASWTENRVSAAFDISTAPVTGQGYFIGDYQGLTSTGGNVFLPFFARTTGNPNNRTDVFSAPAVSATSSARAVRRSGQARASAAVAEPSPEFARRVAENVAFQLRARGRPVPKSGPTVAPPRPRTLAH